jgi:hypothetical protein
MKRRVSFITLLFVASCFSGRLGAQGKLTPAEEEKVGQAKRAAIDDYYSGKEYLSRDGSKEAEVDITKGTPKYKEYGRALAPRYRQARDQVFIERFGIKHEQIAGCFVNEPLVAYAKAYNARILEYVAEQFGEGAWQEANAEAFRRIDEIQKQKNG